MNVIDLDRQFVPLTSDSETPEWDEWMGREYGEWLGWDELITRPRVVLLAEANSGKTVEFQLRAALLRARGEAAFFLRVEDLADGALVEGLTPEDETRFRAWLDGDGPGRFFVDSVDEARLNHKSFDTALKRFRRDVGPAIDRAHVFLSCRVTDWKGKRDRDLVDSLLPVPRGRSLEAEDLSADELLLRPMFNARSDPIWEEREQKKDSGSREALLIVRLAELTSEQRAELARWAGIADAEAFIREVDRQGLHTFAERPGDLLELAEYGKAHRSFSSFAAMTRFSIMRKLAERDTDRPDADVLTDERAGEGAERIAAALTLGKALTLRVPGQEPDPTLAAGALDPGDVLPDWKPNERAALLRRGVFTPATYGRVRFHHRSTQEYLTAQWLRRMLDSGCPRSEVMGLLFGEPYGVRTAVPSMRPVAAWLALDDPEIRSELLQREPIELIRHGDPRSLPLSDRARLLIVYADRHHAGEVTNDNVEHRSFWMFSHPALAPAIREAWERNTDPSFRTDLLWMVREGVITECVDLARAQAFDTGLRSYFRSPAVAAMVACGDQEELSRLAAELMADPSVFSARNAVGFARHLFPAYLSLADLIWLIGAAEPGRFSSMAGLPSYLEELWERCPPGERLVLLEALADLCLTPPFRGEYHRVSARHSELPAELAPLASRVALNLGDGPVPPALIKACAAIERSGERTRPDARQKLQDALRGRRDFHRELFWFDVQEARHNREREVTSWWHLGITSSALWQLTQEDADWLMARVRDESDLQDRRIALSALPGVLGIEVMHARAQELRALVAGIAELETDLARALAPPAPDLDAKRYATLERRAARWNEKEEVAARQSLLDFAARIRSDSSHLRDPVRLVDSASVSDLLDLTDWLSWRTGMQRQEAARRWPLLGDVHGDEVAQAYRAGMKLLWRVTVPRSVDRSAGQVETIGWNHLLSWYGIGLEAGEGEGWAERLSADEAERAVLHAFSVGERPSQWIEVLARTHPERVKPIVTRQVETEWAAASGLSRLALNGIADGADSYLLQMADVVIDRLYERPGSSDTFDIGLRVLARLPLTTAARAGLVTHARNELRLNAADYPWALRQLALLFTCDAEVAVDSLEGWLAASDSDQERSIRGERAFAELFWRHWPGLPERLHGQPVEALKRLALLAYRTIRVGDDTHHEGVFTPSQRDHAESGRSRVLDALLEAPGRETYNALMELSEEPAVTERRKRFRELAHRRAENDAELPAWSAADVVSFERRHAAPAKSGRDLLRIACAILDDIQTGFAQADASSRRVLASAGDEQAVQHWLAEQFRLRSKDRFHVHREVEVADKKEPDILLSSTSAPVEVAVEIKHGGMRWSLHELEDALRRQLVGDYLRPANRRHGLLVITNHGERTWRDSDTKATLNFEQLLTRLRTMSARLQRNETGPVEVVVLGIDAAVRGASVTLTRRSKRSGAPRASRDQP
jgi:hypothetical protein